MDQSSTTDLPGSADLQAGPDGSQVVYVSYRWPHLSRSSGYDRLVEAMAGRAYQWPRPPFQSLTSASDALARLSRRVRGVVLDRYYTNRFYRQERHLIRAASREPRGLYHFLYGESAFRRFKRARPGKKVIASFHQPPSILERFVAEPEAFGDLDAAILLGNNQREYFERYLPAERIHLVPHGVDSSAFVPPRERTTLKRLLFVGVWLRDFITARRVMERLRKVDKGIRLDVVTLPKCKAHFIGLDNVRVHCGISELELVGLYQRSALLFLPLKDGTFNNAIGEAMACGLPVVSTDVGGMRDYVGGDCGELLPTRDAEGYVEVVRQLLDDPDRCAAMSAAARARAEALDWRALAPRLREVYQPFLGSPA